MARSLWFVAGAGAGVYAVSRARRAAEALTAGGLSDRVNALTLGARLFRDEVAAGREEKETQLRKSLGLVPHGLPELARGAATDTGPTRIPPTDNNNNKEIGS